MALFAAGGEAVIGPIDFTPLYLFVLLVAGAVLAPVIAVIGRVAGTRWGAAWRWDSVVGLACAGIAAGWYIVWLL